MRQNLSAASTVVTYAHGLGITPERVKITFSELVARRPLLIITLGYPAKPTREKKRKDFIEMVRYNSYK